jgi:prophage maintenance system killer protein
VIEYLTIKQVIELHDEMLKRYGGLPGIRDKNLL